MLRVSLLGEQVIADEETGAVLTRSPRSVALVAYLVVHAGLAQPRRLIAGLFWPDSTDAQALTNLRRELHQLRHVLGEQPSLAVTGRDLCWLDTPTSRVDVREFDVARRAALAAADARGVVTHANAALAAYRGELLPSLADDWVLTARAELDRQCVELCDLVCRTPSGDPAAALAAARRRIRLRPLEETGYRTLMELQADAGDRAGAVSTYHRCASVLERELGVVPAEPTRAALRRLLAQPGPEVGRVAGAAAPGLVGRSAELARLGETWRAAAAGRAGVVLVRGDAGVGKTRLVTEFAGLARAEGAVVATGRCFGAAGRLPLAPVAEWLRTPAVQRAAAALDPVWRAEVDRLLPAARPVAGGHPTVDAWQRLRFFEGLARALTAGERPTLLVLDNAQWCDEQTSAFITFCLGLVPDAPLLVAGTLREGEAGAGAWITQLRDEGKLTALPLRPFDAEGTARLGEAVAGRPLSESDRTLLHAATGGFPLYVVEALRTGASPPSGRLTEVLRARLEQPGPAAREVAGLAAAAGRDFTLELLTEASDLDADTVVDAVDELWRRRILREVGGGYDFTHDLLRDAAYQQVSPPRRWLLHRRLAQGMELLHAGDPDAVAAQLAEQYARGGRPDRAVEHYRRAATVAARTFAHADAIRLLKEALALVRARPPSGNRDRAELAVLEALAGPLNAHQGYSSPELQRTLERSLALAESLDSQDSALTALLELWSSQFVRGRTAQAHESAERALSLLTPGMSPALIGSAHFIVAGSSVSLGRPAEGLRHFALGAEHTRGASTWPIGTRPDIHGPAWAAHAQWLLGHEDAAVASCAEAVERARAAGHPYSVTIALAYAGITHQLRHDRPALSAAVAELRGLCDRYGFAYYREWALVLGGWTRGGAAGLAAAQEGVAHLKAEGAFARMPYWLTLVAELSAPEAARATLDAALAAGQARDDRWWLPEVLRLRAAHDADPGPRLRAAAELARAQGSVTLLRRCEAALAVSAPS
ncbi:AAA family ATPase [Amycolatopsis sp. NPDC051128]|uniref:ATP-binding protein n=1 Tax=Amycolatopsis sp. NPDC051128 TaxID=3155412 RepID=UPI0034495CEE